MQNFFVYLTLQLEENTEEGATTVSRNKKSRPGITTKRQGEMKHCSFFFFFFNVNAFSCVRLCVVLVCALLGNILWSFDSAFPTIRWLPHRWKIVWPAGGHLCLCVCTFTAYTHICCMCLSEVGQRGVFVDFTVLPVVQTDN